MRCAWGTEDRGRCILEEGHDTGPGIPHQFGAPAPSAAEAAAELTARLGIPCTVLDVEVPPDDGDVTCARADGTPEAAAEGLIAIWRTIDWQHAPEMRMRAVRAVILDYLREAERDWAQLAKIASHEASVSMALDDAKNLHDAQVAELLERIGGAL